MNSKRIARDNVYMHNKVVHGNMNTVGKISSGSALVANVVNENGSELRDMKIFSPAGISYGAPNDAEVQIIDNNTNTRAVVGVYDDSKPDAKSGEVILYSGNKQYMVMVNNDGIFIRAGSTTYNLLSLLGL